MCNACGNPAVPGHWTEAGTTTPSDRLRARFHRAAVLNTILRPYGLTAHDDGSIPGIQLATLFGATTIVNTLADVWTAAERLTGKPIDPLDHRYLDGV